MYIPKMKSHVMLNQFNVKDGRKAYGIGFYEAILKELMHLNLLEAHMPRNKEELSYDQRKSLYDTKCF